MARKTRLALISERPVLDGEAAQMAGQALDEAEALENPAAAPADILAALATVRGQLAETTRIANTAVETANQERARANTLVTELGAAKSEAAKIREIAGQEIARVNTDAAASVATIQRQAQVTERAAAAAGLVHQAASVLATLLSFVIDRAPVLLTLVGAFVLARAILADPTMYQLGVLGLYGAVAVMPAVWLSVRRG